MTAQQFSSKVINNQFLQSVRYIPSAKGQIRNPLISKPVTLTTRQKDHRLEFKKTRDLRLCLPPTQCGLFNSGKQTGCCLMLMVPVSFTPNTFL